MPASTMPDSSIWATMGYVPPRGKCHSGSLMSSCPCLRFMLHPLKAATSFDCDGCNHHASLHAMENPEEDAIVERWKAVERNAASASSGRGGKRRRIENGVGEASAIDLAHVAVSTASASSLSQRN